MRTLLTIALLLVGLGGLVLLYLTPSGPPAGELDPSPLGSTDLASAGARTDQIDPEQTEARTDSTAGSPGSAFQPGGPRRCSTPTGRRVRLRIAADGTCKPEALLFRE